MSLVATVPSLVAEMIGTGLLVFVGCATVISVAGKENPNLSVAFAFGIVLIALIYIFGSLSGGQFNPSVTGAFALDGRMSYGSMFFFWVAQLIGALIASALLLFLFGKASGLGQSIGIFTTEAPWKAVLIEFIATYVLVLVILVVTASPRQCSSAGLIIGLTLFAGILFAFYFTGGSLNIVRTIGPALFAGNLSYIWIYFLAAILASVAAFLTYRYFFPRTMPSLLV